MKKIISTLSLSICIGLSSSVVLQAQDSLAPAATPPGGIAIKKAPQFVCFGWDDNYYSGIPGSGGTGGMTWILDFTKTLKNPAGSSNASTFDNSDVRCTFFNIATYAQESGEESATYVKQAWRRAFDEGHEIGNHTFDHPNGTAFSESDWEKQILANEAVIFKPYDALESPLATDTSKGLGLTKANIYGFRTPFLAYSVNLFNALKKNNYLYDCTIEEGWQTDQDGTNMLWPYTLDNGSPGHDVLVGWGTKPALTPVKGLWEMPAYCYIVPPDNLCAYYGCTPGLRNRINKIMSYFDVSNGKLTGFDYNMMGSKADGAANLNKEECLAIFKYTFDLHYNGNRSPFLIGAHTSYYSSFWNEAPAIPKPEDRQWIMEELIKYMLTKSDTRIVRYVDVVNWMKSPVALADNAGPFTIEVLDSNGTVDISPVKTSYTKDEQVTLTPKPASGYVFESWAGSVNSLEDTITITMDENKLIYAIFRTAPITCDSSLNTFHQATFSAAKDGLGSKAVMSRTYGATPSISLDWEMVKRTSQWPWLELDIKYPIDLFGMCSMDITYSSDKPLVLSLMQAPLSGTGESYQIELPVQATAVSITKNITDFKQPSWATTILPLDLTKVTSIAISPNIDTETAADKGKFTFSELQLYGLYLPTPVGAGIQTFDNLNVNMYTDVLHNLHVQVNETNTYTIHVFTMEGKMLFNTSRLIAAGSDMFNLPASLNKGIYIVRISTNKGIGVKKVFLD